MADYKEFTLSHVYLSKRGKHKGKIIILADEGDRRESRQTFALELNAGLAASLISACEEWLKTVEPKK